MNKKTEAINTLRLLSVEQIEKANSGHPGVALDAAPIFFTLYNSIMKYNSKNPKFFNRDRFVVSAGHASSLLYSSLHLFGYKVTMEDLKKFRQIGSITPGHPEYGVTEGVETSTGPLGQGVSNAVGMAIASKYLASTFNKPNFELINNSVFCFVGEGCLMEGISNEALSLAGNLKLDNLIVIYDCNKITIEGSSEIAFTENIKLKYKALGFNVIEVENGNDINNLENCLSIAKNNTEKPTMVIVNTKIGFGSSFEGTNLAHGKPLNKKDIEYLKMNLKFEHKPFTVDKAVLKLIEEKLKQNIKEEQEWNDLLKLYEQEHYGLYSELEKYLNNDFKIQASKNLYNLELEDNLSIRDLGHQVLQELKVSVPNLIGGSADIAPSSKAYMEDFGAFASDNYNGRNIHFGIREHAMSGIVNGINLYGGLYAFGSTYLAFTDYMKAGMRMSALMNIPSLQIITHDSLLIGEDGPTHQAVEQLVGLRAMPNMRVFRPCNASEVIAGFIVGLENDAPITLVFAKQKIKAQKSQIKDALKGGYIFSEETGTLDLIIIATGSEIEISLKAKEVLEKMGIGTRIVSMPCIELFEKQNDRYKNHILPKRKLKRIAVEAGSSYSFYKYVGFEGKVIGMDTFGASGKSKDLAKKFGFTSENIVNVAISMFSRRQLKKEKKQEEKK